MQTAALIVQGAIAIGVAALVVQLWLARRTNRRLWHEELEQLKYLGALEVNNQAIEHEQLREAEGQTDVLVTLEERIEKVTGR